MVVSSMIKDDINFLEYPNWMVSNKSKAHSVILKREDGFYEMKSPEALPGRFDKVVLYFLLHKLFEQADVESHHVVTTRYEIARNVLFQEKNFSKQKYLRIMLALKRWKAIYIRFEGVFFERDNATVKYFSIIDYVSLDKKTNKLSIKFNEQYIKQLRMGNTYRLIDFHVYKKLTRPISARLYELLTKNLMEQDMWCIDVINLADRLTVEKKAYPSQVVAAVKPAVDDINKYSNFSIDFDYDKDRTLCIFRKDGKSKV